MNLLAQNVHGPRFTTPKQIMSFNYKRIGKVELIQDFSTLYLLKQKSDCHQIGLPHFKAYSIYVTVSWSEQDLKHAYVCSSYWWIRSELQP